MDFIEIELKQRTDDYAMSELQSHNYYELYFLLEGERCFFYENKMFRVSGHAFCVIPPFHMHKTSGGPYRRININISPDLLDAGEVRLMEECAARVAFLLPPERAEFLLRLLEEAAAIDCIDVQRRRTLALSFVHTLLYLLEKSPPLPLDCSASVNESGRDTHILQIVSYINEHYREEFSLRGLSGRFYISTNMLCSRFRAAMNCSVMQYLAFVRINRAKELLSTTGKSMEEIAELCGFSSANYFSLIFKKNVGLSPANYRKTR